MTGYDDNTVIRHQAAQAALRQQFLKWQCKARQNAVRMQGGRPSPSMRPMVMTEGRALGQITIMINRREPYSRTSEFRHMVLRTPDPRARLDSALELLAEDYFQRANEFSDRLTALFGPDDPLVDHLVEQGACHLEFNQPRQRYTLPCSVTDLPEQDPAYQATYWHNHLFNPALPPGVRVLAFNPDWSTAEADPSPI